MVQDNDEDERPVYFVNKVIKVVEIHYLKIERLALEVVIIVRKLRQYSQGHPIIVKTNYPIKRILKKPDLGGRMIAWRVDLSEYDIMYAPRNNIKSHVLEDFLIELSAPTSEEMSEQWILSVGDLYNLKGIGAGIVLKGSGELILEQSLYFSFQASNNQSEYEAMISILKLAREVRVSYLLVWADSQLIASPIRGDYQTKDTLLLKYL